MPLPEEGSDRVDGREEEASANRWVCRKDKLPLPWSSVMIRAAGHSKHHPHGGINKG